MSVKASFEKSRPCGQIRQLGSYRRFRSGIIAQADKWQRLRQRLYGFREPSASQATEPLRNALPCIGFRGTQTVAVLHKNAGCNHLIQDFCRGILRIDLGDKLQKLGLHPVFIHVVENVVNEPDSPPQQLYLPVKGKEQRICLLFEYPEAGIDGKHCGSHVSFLLLRIRHGV